MTEFARGREGRCNIEVTAAPCAKPISGKTIRQFLKADITKCFYTYPLKILTPTSSGNYCRWIYLVTYGGGLVPGDRLSAEVTVGEACCVLWTSQAFQKVYPCNDNKTTNFRISFSVSSFGLLCVLPDPVVCFKNANYNQEQDVFISSTSNLVFLDWLTSGRMARGERWEFTRLKTTLSVFLDSTLVFRDVLCLKNTSQLELRTSMKQTNIVGFCFITGPDLRQFIEGILCDVGCRQAYGNSPSSDILMTVSPYYHQGSTDISGCVIRFSGWETSKVMFQLEKLLQPIYPILGGNPFYLK
ncbi:urease accessory protein D-like isoform X1 [Limulus polyphemus]|uniref:Urease accessory protein D-like isoform X1 n=1 Tax=Limulus polyphemus TaxID=6850 RepID=A0ABM1BQS3_LIMPO|nr:urease accessory protein D-like isoform X1 [Limulus polyphemus]